MESVEVPGNGGFASFVFIHNIYGICGNNNLEIGQVIDEWDPTHGTIVLGSAGSPPTYGSTFKVYIEQNAAAFADPEPAPASVSPGTFQVVTSGGFTESDNYFAGIASKNHGNLIPNIVFHLNPQITYTITPHIIYYIATGSYKTGTIVDILAQGNPLKLQFTDGDNTAKTIYGDDEEYSVPAFSKT